jgi:hypothetical protein
MTVPGSALEVGLAVALVIIVVLARHAQPEHWRRLKRATDAYRLGGSQRTGDTLTTELVREDTAGRLYPDVELKVEGDLRAYEPTNEDVAAVVKRVMYLIAADAVKS